MWGVFDKAVEFVRSTPMNKTKRLVYRDELSRAPLIRREERNASTRVKILMTKEEAERFLSKCKDGGRLEFKDVVCELMKIPENRVSVVDPATCRYDGGVLKSIPEEW